VWGLGGIAGDFNSRLLDPDWDRFAPLFEAAISRVPELADAEIVTLINGPEAFTPDGEFILARARSPGSGRGRVLRARHRRRRGMGQLMAEWIIEDSRASTPGSWNSRRFGPQYRSRTTR